MYAGFVFPKAFPSGEGARRSGRMREKELSQNSKVPK